MKGIAYVLVSSAIIYALVRARTRDVAAAYQALADNEARLTSALGSAREAVWDIDLQTEVITYSRGTIALFGATPPADLERLPPWAEWVHPNDALHAEEAFVSCLEGQVDRCELTYPMRRSDGSYFWVHSQGTISRDESGRPLRIVGTHLDMDRQKQHERELERVNRALNA